MVGEASTEWTKVKTLGGVWSRFPPDEPVDARIAAVAVEQHGVVSVAQIAGCGLSASAVRSRVACGRLHRVRRGVYALSPSLPPLGATAAAVLACGAGSSACHLTAAELQDMRRGGRVLIDVAVRSPSGRGRDGLITHAARGLRPQDVEVVRGIPTTSVARTLLDCAPIVGRRGVEQMIQRSEWNRTFDLVEVSDALARWPTHPGAAPLGDAVGDAAQASGHVASSYENDLLLAFRAHPMHEPECNPPIALGDGEYAYPDFLWRTERLAVEVDPRSTHDRTASYRSDRQRDRALRRVAGIDTMRFCDEDLADPSACAAEVAVELAERSEFRPLSGRNS